MFTLIDRESWIRKEYFEHYYRQVPCSYSLTCKLDVTPIVKERIKLYPAMLYSLTTIVNRHDEFRTAFDDKGRLGVYDRMVPCYTIFHKDSQTFSNVWTEYDENFRVFFRSYLEDLEKYGLCTGFEAKPGVPENSFTVSMLPWVHFEGFHLNLAKGNDYLLPIFTLGKYTEDNGRFFLPAAVQVHHGVCDGFHVGRFLQELQDLIVLGLDG